MLPYASISSVLEEIGKAKRRDKASLAADFLADIPPQMLCSCCRLIIGELWPPWEQEVAGIGPASIAQALGEISNANVQELMEQLGEIGAVAEAAVRQKSQHSISGESLEAGQVYRSIIRISMQKGLDSEHRKGAILRGLFLQAQPIEAKYLARTFIKGTLVGLGPRTIMDAISQAFRAEKSAVHKAFAILPDLGRITVAASRGSLNEISIFPSQPLCPMLIRKAKDDSISRIPRAYLPRYPGLRVQVHKTEKEFFIYTLRLKNITSALMSLSPDLLANDSQFIAEAILVCFQDGKMMQQSDVVSLINRRHLSRKSPVLPSLMAMDLLWQNGVDLTKQEYATRRKRLMAMLGSQKSFPIKGISLAEERILEDPKEVHEFSLLCRQKGIGGLFSRDTSGLYDPGSVSRHDCIIKLKA
jgi:DNA ligase 1